MNTRILSTTETQPTDMNHFAEFLSAIHSPAMVINKDGLVLECNHALSALYNTHKFNLLHHNLFHFCKSNDISPPFDCIADALNNIQAITKNTFVKSGKELHLSIQWSASQIQYGKYATAILMIGFEITHFVNASIHEKHIKDSIIDHIPNHLIYWKDKNSVYLGCNSALAIESGFESSTDITGKTDDDLPTSKEQNERYRATDRLVVETGQAILNIEEEHTLSNGKVRTLSTSKSPLYDEHGNICGVLGISSDITGRKRIEKELFDALEKAKKAEITRAKAEAARLVSSAKAEAEEEMRRTVMVLVGSIVHDLRTPISTIRTVADILDHLLPLLLNIHDKNKLKELQHLGLLNKNNWDYVANKTGINAIKNAVFMIDDFIKTSLRELKNAQQEQSMKSFKDNLNKCSSRRIIENTLESYPFPPNTIVHQDTSYDFYLMGNTILIMKILFNLIKNALEQIALTGHGELSITTEAGAEENIIKIKDTAGGASPEVVANVFKGYFSTKKNGTGVGLAFCKKTMENFGGDLICNSIYGESMEFILVFPKIRQHP